MNALVILGFCISQGHAQESVLVAKTLGIPKISQSYALSEHLEESLEQSYGISVGILPENPCLDTTCQLDIFQKESAPYLLLVEISDKSGKKQAFIQLYNREKSKVQKKKTIKAASLEELQEALPSAVLALTKRSFEGLSKKEDKKEDQKEDQSAPVSEETVVPEEQEAVEVTPKEPLKSPYSGIRIRLGDMMSYGSYAQSSEGNPMEVAASVEYQGFVNKLYIQGEWRHDSLPLRVHFAQGNDFLGTSFNDQVDIFRLDQWVIGAGYIRELTSNLIAEGGISYRRCAGLGYVFTDNRVSVGTLSQDLQGVGLDLGLVSQFMGLDFRLSFSEVLAPRPIRSELALMAEWKHTKLLSFESALHAGIQFNMQHFSFSHKEEDAKVDQLQVGLMGGWGVWF